MIPDLQDSLDTMASTGDVNGLKTLLFQESLSKEVTQKLLMTAAEARHLDIVNLLLDRYPSIPLNEPVVRSAIVTGSIPIFQALLARDPSTINMQFDRGGTPLMLACMSRQNVEYLRFLLESGADPNQDPDVVEYPLALVAALYKDTAAIDLLLQHGAHLEHSHSLASAAILGNESMILHLLDCGASPEADTSTSTAPCKSSALQDAVRKRHVRIIKILLQHGADPNVIDPSGDTAFGVSKQMSIEGEDMSEIMEVLEGKQG